MPITTAASDNMDKIINEMYHDQRKGWTIFIPNIHHNSPLNVRNEILHR